MWKLIIAALFVLLPVGAYAQVTGPGNIAASGTAAAVPANAGYTGLNNGGNLIGMIGDSSGRAIVVGPGTAGTPSGGVQSVQGVASGTNLNVNIAAGSIGNTTFGATLNATPSLANGNGVVPTQGGAVLSATNGIYANLLQGNAVLASGNPIFAQLTAGSAAVGTVTTTPKAGTFTIAGCTVGTSSAQCVATATVTNHVQIQNASTSASVACAWAGGTATLNNSGSVQLAPGQSANWGPATAGVPSGAMDCIASAASTPLYVEYN